MAELRTGRRKYYDIFSHFYDGFIKLHSCNYNEESRKFLVDSAQLETEARPKVLDVCCGTGSVSFSFDARFTDILPVGYDFSHGMLLKALEKNISKRMIFIEGDAAALPFADDIFDVVCCSHALYELKGPVREDALLEMKRVVKPGGRVLIMEHEVPRKLLIRMLFKLRMRVVGSKDAAVFLKMGTTPFTKIFSDVTLSHTPSGKSRLLICRK